MTDLIDWFLGLLTAAQWDMWRNWIATIVAIGVASVALRTYVANARVRKFEQSRLVYAKVFSIDTCRPGDSFTHHYPEEPALSIDKAVRVNMTEVAEKTARYTFETPAVKIGIFVGNSSKERIGPVTVRPFNRSAGADIDASYTFETIDPESEGQALLVVVNPFPDGLPIIGLLMKFQDARGKWWRRNLTEAVKPTRAVKQRSVRDHYWVDIEPPAELPSFRGQQYRYIPAELQSLWQQVKRRLRPKSHNR